MSTAYKKFGQQLVEIQEEVIADRSIAMKDRIDFISFTNKIKQTLDNKVISESKAVLNKEVILNN
jgi:hypothetical protein